MRKAKVTRATKETDVEVAVDLDGTGVSTIATGIGFFDHMLDLLARHSRIDIVVKAKGDLHIDHHHTTEDVGIALGQAVRQALGDMKGITRYADVHVPMDEALTRVAIDISGRPFLVFFGFTHCPDVCPTTLFEVSEIFRALGPDADRTRALFITVDPERDTPAVIKDYLSSFDPHLSGLTGDPAAIAAVAKAYRVYFKKVPLDEGGYTMDHTAIV